MLSRRHFLQLGAAAVTTAGMGQAFPRALAWSPLPDDQLPAANDPHLHLLNRITWGATPAEKERIDQIGADAYLEEQLDPDSIDDADLDARMRLLPIMTLNRVQITRLADPYYRPWVTLVSAMVTRAVYSKRQLQERMVEFWADHFNIPADDNLEDLIPYHRETLQKHALGSFRQLLLDTAQAPVMLYYLDNYLNVAEAPNENWARELMELHTLGVAGGYTEADVKAVARAFTGWTVHDGAPGGFFFDPDVHDTEEKLILGHTLPAGRGIEDGLHVLQILVTHAATARYLSRKLCVRFVSDNPPESLVESTALAWIMNDGEIIPVLRHILTSDEFKASAGQKLRRPLDFFIGALRATGTEYGAFWAMEHDLESLAQFPYGWHPPDGFPDVAGAWMSSGGLLERWNLALTLTHGAATGDDGDRPLITHLRERIGDPETVGDLLDQVAWQVFAAPLPQASREPFARFVVEGGNETTPVTNHLLAQKLATLYGLMLASPIYQWR